MRKKLETSWIMNCLHSEVSSFFSEVKKIAKNLGLPEHRQNPENHNKDNCANNVGTTLESLTWLFSCYHLVYLEYGLNTVTGGAREYVNQR